MNKFFSLILLLQFSSLLVFGKTNIRGKIIDKVTKQELASVGITMQNSKYLYLSDELGFFKIKIKKKHKYKYISFSLEGYESKIVYREDLLKNTIIEMTPLAELNDDAEILTWQVGESVVLGKFDTHGILRFDRKKNESLGFGTIRPGDEVGVILKNNRKILLKDLNFVINDLNGDSVIMQVKLYKINGKIIGEQLLKKNIYLKTYKDVGTKTIDIKDQKIVAEGNLLLSLEWIKSKNKFIGNEVLFQGVRTNKIKATLTKRSNDEEFGEFNFNRLKPCFYINGIVIR